MAKMKAIFIGDYANSETVDMLKAFCTRYCESLDILVAGYGTNRIREISEIADNCSITTMNTSKFIFYKNTAQYVIITSPAARYMREKTNQKIIYVMSEIEENSFAGVTGDISLFITDNTQTVEYLSERFEQIEVKQISNLMEEYVNSLPIPSEKIPTVEEHVLFKSGELIHLRDIDGSRYYFEGLAKSEFATVIAMSTVVGSVEATSRIALDDELRVKAILEGFEGTIVFYNEDSETVFWKHVKDHDVSLKTDNFCYVDSLQIQILENAVKEHKKESYDSESSLYMKYRSLMDDLYVLNHCENSKVSVIICRYNTPYDLLSRTVESALNCGHNNIEVIIVDDGSESSLEKEIKSKFSDDRVLYFYKTNEGPGLSRDYGVDRATGKYIFYLDSDDTIHTNGMRCLVSHADFFNLNLVIGKRTLCDELGVTINESLSNLSGKTFRCYYNDDSTHEIYADCMVNNLLIRKSFLEEKGIRFKSGLYEDVEYSNVVYSACPEFHYLNVVIHDWYQYGDSSSVSSTPSISNFKQRIIMEELAWQQIPEKNRPERLRDIISIDFNLYLNAFLRLGSEEQAFLRSELREFIVNKEKYIIMNKLSERVRELVRALINDNQKYFDYVIRRYYAPKSVEPADNYVIFTHYHLYVAIIRTIASRKRTRLYLGQFYTSFNTNIVYKLKKCGLFEDVKTFTFGDTVTKLFEDLKERPNEADIVIPNHLYPLFAITFKDCNPKEDTIYIFSDTHPYWYYIEREFSNIVKLEDAYNSFDREVKTHKMTGIWSGIQKYEGVCYPMMFYRSDKIQKIIVSNMPENIPDYYYEKIEIQDTKELADKTKNEARELLFDLYDVDSSAFTEDSTLLLTQPLALFGYCSQKQQRRLMKKMCEGIESSKILVKPHPADTMNYKYLGGTILTKNVPIEVYNYLNTKIASAVTFGSSAIETITFAKEKKNYFKLHDIEFDEVVVAIKEIIKEPTPTRVAKALKRRAKRLIKK